MNATRLSRLLVVLVFLASLAGWFGVQVDVGPGGAELVAPPSITQLTSGVPGETPGTP